LRKTRLKGSDPYGADNNGAGERDGIIEAVIL
jgi:hypothetical protein